MKISIERTNEERGGGNPGGVVETAALIRRISTCLRAAGEHSLDKSEWRGLVEQRAEFKRLQDELSAAGAAATTNVEGRQEDLQVVLSDAIDGIDRELDKRTEAGDRKPRNLRSGRGETTERPRGEGFRDLRTGKFVRTYAANERLVDGGERRQGGELSIGHMALRAITGGWANKQIAEEARAMSIGSDSAGGYLVPEPLSREVIDLARAKSVVMRAGARVVLMDASTLDLARIESDVSWSWKAENATGFTPGDLTLGRVRLSAKTVGCIIPLSEELWQDGQNTPEVLEKIITDSMATEMDRVCLHGSGVGAEPTGLYGTASIGTFNMLSGSPSNYDFVSRCVQTVRTANHEPTGMVAHPRTYGVLDRLKDGQNQPLMPPKSFQDLKHFPTSNVRINFESGGSPNDNSCAFIGKWDELLLGMRLELQMLADRTGYDGTNNAMTQYKVLLRAVMRMDVAVMRPAAFCVATNIGA